MVEKTPEFNYSPIHLKSDKSFEKGELFRIKSNLFEEASGIAPSHNKAGHYYVHNDSGNPAEIFLIDSTGNLKAQITLKGIKNRDWEDISTGPGPIPGKSYIYLADIGDNQYTHKKYRIYRFEEPEFEEKANLPAKLEVDGIHKFSIQYPGAASYNAEAFMTDPVTATCYIITKSKIASVFSFKLPSEPSGTITSQHLTDLPLTKLTAADISGKGDILMKDYSRVYLWQNLNSTGTDSLLRSIPVESSYTIEPQGEGICWASDGRSYYTISEVRGGSTQYLIRYTRTTPGK